MDQNLRKREPMDGRLDNVKLEIYRLYIGEARSENELEKGLTLSWHDD